MKTADIRTTGKIQNALAALAAFSAILVLSGTLFVHAASANDAASQCANGTTLTASEAKIMRQWGLITATVSINSAAMQTTATIENHTECNLPASFGDYKMYDQKLSTQVFYQGTATKTIAPHSSATFTIGLPSCMTQADAYYGDVWHNLFDDNRNGDYTLGWAFAQNNGSSFSDASGNFCSNTPPPAPIVIYCAANPTDIQIGGTATYSASVTGGNGSYAYSWTGTDGLTGNGSSASKSYSASGTKTGTVTVTSGNQSATKSCNVTVEQPTIPTIAVSCVANPASANIGDVVTYSANPSGGNGSYAYSWTGTDGLTGNGSSASKSYSASGYKTGTVTVTSNGATASASCGTSISTPVQNTFIGSCSASASTVNVGQQVTWLASASGGQGTYSYRWNGSNNFFSSTNFLTESFGTAGIHTESVTITSGSQSITENCSVNVVDNTTHTNNLVGSCTVDDSSISVGDTATWRADVSGGTGNYSYTWSGDDSLSGFSRDESHTYNSTGNKQATVRVTDSAGNTLTSSCNLNVSNTTTNNNDLRISCEANPDTAGVGDQVTWRATASGGDGSYEYDWTGDNGLNSSNRTVTKSYSSTGDKEARVRVTSDDGESRTATCDVNIRGNNNVTVYTNPDNTNNVSQVYLSQVPYTGPMDNAKMALYIFGFLLWSGAVSYYILQRKYGSQALAVVTAKAAEYRDEFSEKLSSLRSLRAPKSPEAKAAEAALTERQETLKKLWDRTS